MKLVTETYIPFVFKDRDELLVELPKLATDLCGFGMYDSFPFCDVMPNGKKLNNCSDEEIIEMIHWQCDPVRFFSEHTHPENDCYDEYPAFSIDCPSCGWSLQFNNLSDIPATGKDCPCCGVPLLKFIPELDDLEIQTDYDSKIDRLKEIFTKIIQECGGEVGGLVDGD